MLLHLFMEQLMKMEKYLRFFICYLIYGLPIGNNFFKE